MIQVSEALELVIVFAVVIVGLGALYFAQRWMNKE
jgi:hypothetical protein